MKRPYNKKDWTEVVLMFLFLTAAVIVLGAAAALMGRLIFSLV